MSTNPYFTQYHTQRFSFIGSPQQRDGSYTKDQRFVNMYPELIKSPITDGKKYYLKKRPGTLLFQTYTGSNVIAQGFFFWPLNQTYYAALGGVLYANTTPIITLTNSNGNVGIIEFKSDTEDVLFVCDGTTAWTISGSNTVSHITDPNLPSPHTPTPVYLDGYVFLASAGTQTIHNSNLQDPTVWPSDGFIDAEMFPDTIVALAKVQNYIAAVGTGSIEWFYDNANATGSPLQRNAPAVTQFGCPAFATVNQTERQLILVGQTGNGGRTVWVIDGFQPTEIANEPVREALDAESIQIGLATAFTIQVSGHKFYVLNLANQSRTFVYDFEEQMWHEWTTGLAQQFFNYKFAVDSPNGVPVLLSLNGGYSVQLSAQVYTDLGQPIHCAAITSKIDFDTIKRKRIYRVSLIGDSPNGDINTPVTVMWSDDDYNTWYTATSPLLLNGTYPTLTQLGYSRRRAFQFVYQQPYALRLESFEVDLVQEVRR